MKTLLELLGKDLYEQVLEKLGDTQVFLHKKDEKVIVDNGKLIPPYRLDEVINKNKTLTEQLDKAEKDLKELKKLASGNEELTKKIETLQSENKTIKEDFAKKESLMKKQLVLKESLLNAGVLDGDARDLLLQKFELDKVEIENGKVKDFDNLIKPIKENKTLSQLFGEIKIKGKDPNAASGKDGDYYSREQVQAMSQDEVTKNFEVIQKSMPLWDKN
ncbi:phage scaffolding protein [Immundisolibacter sp.]